MKKIFFLLIIINHSLLIDNCFCQWVLQNSGTSAGLFKIKFINENTGWVCGNLGTILKTTNAGLNWIAQYSGVNIALTDIHPVDSEYVYCVGTYNTILKTKNGGSNWDIIRTSINYSPYLALYLIDRNTGWICGSGYWIMRTIDGFESMDSSYIPNIALHDIYFKDNLNGLTCGDGGVFYKTTNGGLKWKRISIFGVTLTFFGMSFIKDTGWIIGSQQRKVFRTTNFGDLWDSIGRVTPEPDNWGAGDPFFSSYNIGWVCGGSGNVWKTTNGGFNWYKQVIPYYTAYGSVWFVTDSIGWAVGSSGIIIHTTNGGQIVNVNTESTNIPVFAKLFQNYPNPFNAETIIEFNVDKKSKVELKIFDIIGKEVSIVVDEILEKGTYKVKYNANYLSSGIYLYSLISEDKRFSKVMVVTK